MKRANWLVGTLAMALACCPLLGDGMIVPVRPELKGSGNWAVRYHKVHVRVEDQVASVSVDEEFVNLGGSNLEVEYIFPVPPDAAIDSMTLMVNGKVSPPVILRKPGRRGGTPGFRQGSRD